MQRGDVVKVELYGGEVAERRVVEVRNGVVVVTTEEEHRRARAEGRAPVCVGIRMGYVQGTAAWMAVRHSA